MSKPAIVVAGLGRCGTSLLMQMLDLASVPCYGEYPAYEPHDLARGTARAHTGQAVKWLDPHQSPSPGPSNAVCVWLDRDPAQQARSHYKFLSQTHPEIPFGLLDDAALERSVNLFAADRRVARRMVARWPVLTIWFEDLIQTAHPDGARKVAYWLNRFGWHLDVSMMVEAVYPRGPESQPTIAIEMAQSALADLRDATRRPNDATGRKHEPWTTTVDR